MRSHRTASGFADFADPDGIHLPVGSRTRRSLGETKCQPEGRCADEGARGARLGSERQVAGEFPSGAHHDERKARLDAETRRCVFGGSETSPRHDSESPGKSTVSG